MKQQGFFQGFFDFLPRHDFDRQHRKMRTRDVFFEIDLAEARYGRCPDQKFGDHDEKYRQQQKPERQTFEKPGPGRLYLGYDILYTKDRCPDQQWPSAETAKEPDDFAGSLGKQRRRVKTAGGAFGDFTKGRIRGDHLGHVADF